MNARLMVESVFGKRSLVRAALVCGIVGAGYTATTVFAADAAVPTPAISPATLAQGAAIYEHYCTVCHERGLGTPGTQALGFLYGKEKAALADRDNLTPDYVRFLVRNGRGLMPAFRMTEVSEEELKALAAYLSAGPHPAAQTK